MSMVVHRQSLLKEILFEAPQLQSTDKAANEHGLSSGRPVFSRRRMPSKARKPGSRALRSRASSSWMITTSPAWAAKKISWKVSRRQMFSEVVCQYRMRDRLVRAGGSNCGPSGAADAGTIGEAFHVGASRANSCGRPSTTGEQGVPSGAGSEAQLGTECRQRSAGDHGRVPQILGNIGEVAQLGPQVRVLVDLPVAADPGRSG